jgi:glycosyltransferase involved in cell wall biosynthesis
MTDNDLIVYIDSVMRDKKMGQLVISGWSLDPEIKAVPEISIQQAKASTLTKVVRTDVIMSQKLSGDVVAGFQISVTPKGSVPILITFSSNGKLVSKEISTVKEYPLVPGTESKATKMNRKIRAGLSYVKRNGIKATIRRMKIQENKNTDENYQKWIAQHENWDVKKIRQEIQAYQYQPLISILMPTYNVDEKWLRKCIQSVQGQYYENWELCIADDASTDTQVRPVLEQFQMEDERIKVVFREKNGHISKATNSALAIADGEFVALLDNDDELSPIALYEVVKLLNQNSELDLIYSDEDKIDMEGNRFDPAFKPQWSPDLLLGTNYISHLGIYRKSIMEKINGFRVGYEGSQDYDLVLRFTEQTTAKRIAHIPEVLYYWRILPTSTAADQSTKGYAFEVGRKAVEDALQRRNIKGHVNHAAGNGLFDVVYDVLSEDLVSIIIPTRNGYDDMIRCLTSIVEKTTYPNYEIIVADNGSTEDRMSELYQQFIDKLGNRFSVESINIPFNYSRINNLAAEKAKGKYLLFLNNDTEVISPDWVTKMVSFAQFERIGCVGAKLYYPNHTIQHAGVILGLGGAAGHGHHTFPQGDFGYFGKLEINVDYLAVTAACMMMRKADFVKLQGFDEELTVAFNDVDLCLREFELEKNNIWLHGVELYHFESQSRGYENTPEKQARFEKETKMMEDKWVNYIKDDPFYNPNLTRDGGNFGVRVDEKE